MKKTRLVLSTALLTLACSALGSTAEAACDVPVDPKRMVIFVGMNEAFLEREAAEAAACLRGESFTSLPRPLPGEPEAIRAFKELLQLDSKLDDLKDTYSANECQDGRTTGTPCVALQGRIDALTTLRETENITYQSYWVRLKTENPASELTNEFRILLQDLADRKIQPTAIIISGHSNGVNIWGYVGSTTVDKLQAMLQAAFKTKEQLLDKLGMILLWGCNTINPYSSANGWVRILPNLKLIFGFAGSAPSAKNPASPTLLHNILLSGPKLKVSLQKESPETALKTQFDAIRGIGSTIGSAFINDENRSFYYERTHGMKDDKEAWASVVKPVQNITRCEIMRSDLEADQDLMAKIMKGEIEIPMNTSGGFLRELYTRARRNDACRAALELHYTADQVGYALFWHHLKKNTARFLSEKAAPTLKRLGSSTLATEIGLAVTEYNSFQKSNHKKRLEGHRGFSEKAERIAAEYQAYQEAAEEMPWRKKNERRLKRLTKKLDRLEKKAGGSGKNSEDSQSLSESSELRAIRLKYKVQIDMKEISGAPDYEQKLKKIFDGLTSQREANIEDQRLHTAWMKTVDASSNKVASAEEILAQLKSLTESLPPLTVAEVAEMDLATLSARIASANLKLQILQSSVSPLRFKGLSDSLLSLSSVLNGYRQLALELKPECLDFESWHEYTEDENAPALVSRCYTDTQFGRQNLPLQFLPLWGPQQER